MIARRAARELSLLSFSQLAGNIEKFKKKEIEEMLLTSVRTLVNEAENSLKGIINFLFTQREKIENYEIEHPENLKKPIDAEILPVSLQIKTSEMKDKLDALIKSADKIVFAMEIAEFKALSDTEEVKKYTLKIIENYLENKKIIDAKIKECSIGWDISRMIKIDRDILRIALTEMLFLHEKHNICIDEAVELAKKYSAEESPSFINGILAQIVIDNKLE